MHNDESEAPANKLREGGAFLLAAGGLAAAFAGAACCALPTLLGSLGLGSALLGAVALIAGPYRVPLSVAAVLCLIAAGGLLLYRRRSVLCARPWLRALTLVTASVAVLLVVLAAVIV